MTITDARAEIAVLIPCYNEELTIEQVVAQFREQLPGATIYVFDNGSSDDTVEAARGSGAIVFHEARRGKGYVVQSMFQRVNADVYIMVDGDGTYPAAAVHELIAPVIKDEADMVVGSRLHDQSLSEFKFLNRLGNRLFLSALNWIFRVKLTDMLSGYRAFNQKLVKGLPLFSTGFEIETELTIKSLQRRYRIIEVPVDLTHRPEGSHSKIRLVHDGALIVHSILALFRDYKPLTFFGLLGLLLIFFGLLLGSVVILEFIETGSVPRLPSAVLAVGLVLSGMLLVSVGLILHTITRRFQELEYQLQVRTDANSFGNVTSKKPFAQNGNSAALREETKQIEAE
jgi:glycosyltransferase involved in cell wall biosynthesis